MLRSIASVSGSSARLSVRGAAPGALPRTLTISAWRSAKAPNSNPEATGSEEAVHAEKTDADPATLQKQTANKAQQQHNNSSTPKVSPNDSPTQSEDSVHADKHAHDPLPDAKKKKNA